MGFLKIFLVLACAHCVFSDPIAKKSCENLDTECIKGQIQGFLKEYSAGIPDKGVKAMDPMVFSELFEKEDDYGYTTQIKNLKVNGIKDAVVSNLKKSETNEEFTLKFDLDAEAEVTFTHAKRGKTYSGTSKYKASVESDVKFDYTVRYENNLRFVELAPETITCDADNVKITINKELLEELNNDPAAKVDSENYEKRSKELNEAAICFLVNPVLKTVIENLRVVGRSGV